ncbi:MAG: 2-oxoacid:acceptor oxidoreductase subunit alpha [Myxococcales bacterium]|nr:2-oxoacid:acceptor oxidoreductase subunit alpha [Myxococcales bacterium]
MVNLPRPKGRPVDLESAVIRFSGDSGDGMQLTGSQFTNTAALAGNDLVTFPDFPAEIRAPAGTLFGVSGFQLNFAAKSIYTPGDAPDVLVAMNPAALKVNLSDLKTGGILIINQDAFTPANLDKAGFTSNPLEDDSLNAYRLFAIDIGTQTERALAETGLSFKEVGRAKNFWTLGLLYYLYDRPLEYTLRFIEQKFKSKETIAEGNRLALKAGYLYGDVSEIFQETYEINSAQLEPGLYRNITGNQATAWGAIAAGQQAGLPLFYGSYPITPASDVLHELSRHKHFGVKTVQAEDEIAAVAATIGAAWTGQLAMTGSSGPGIALKGEAIGLAVAAELPLVVLNVQRAGPSTGMPTKTEQADLLQAMFGRNGESPVAIVAPQSPADCFEMMIEAFRLALGYMVPVIVLSDGYLANGSEPWKIPDVAALPKVKATFQTTPSDDFHPFQRDEDTLARVWPKIGSPGLEHRIGGLERSYETGHISYDPDNHQRMTEVRAKKIEGMARTIPDLKVYGSEQGGDILLLGWGSTFGAMRQATQIGREQGLDVSHAHLRYLNPFPRNLSELLHRFKRVIVPEMNTGQLLMLLRSRYLIPAEGLNKIEGKPFRVSEILSAIHGEKNKSRGQPW